MTPLVAIDTQTTQVSKTGLGWYVANLIEVLPKVAPEFDFRFVSPSKKGDLNMPQRLLWDQVGFPYGARGAALLHQPAFSTPIFHGRAKVVTTIHDLINVIYPDLPFWSRSYFRFFMPATVRLADHLIADSESTKRDIIRLLSIPAQKITVIPLAVDDEARPITDRSVLRSVRIRYHIPGDYIVHIGTLNPRKNLEFLVRVLSILARRYPKLSLVLSGTKGWYYERIKKTAQALGLSNRVIFTGYLPEEDKPALLSGALVAVFPSLYEGFGLPPLEAMARGTAVVCSNSSSLPEVVGQAGILLDPHDEAGWVAAIDRLLSHPEDRQQLIARGLAQAKKFNWEITARKTADVYAQVLGLKEKQ